VNWLVYWLADMMGKYLVELKVLTMVAMLELMMAEKTVVLKVDMTVVSWDLQTG
jgi:hypothetical protein